MQFDFLICSERSGSNLITRLLNAHSRICAPATTHLFRLLGENMSRYGDLQTDAAWTSLLTDACDLLAATLGAWQTQSSVASLAEQADGRDLAQLLRIIYQAEACANGKQQVFIKEIELFRIWDWLTSEFPQARYVYLVRDPRDMALSWKKSAAIRGGVVRAADAWRRDQDAYLSYFRHLQAKRRVCLVKYEELVQRPSDVLATVCSFLGMTFEPGQLEFHRLIETQEIAQAAVDFGNLQQPILAQNFQKYRRELSADELTYVEACCGELMEQLGYRREVVEQGDVVELRERLLPCEPTTKAAYEQVGSAERTLRSRWVAVTERIRTRGGTRVAAVEAHSGTRELR